MRIAFTFFGIFFIYLFSPSVSYANLLINEVSTFDTDDWVEIYNDSPESVNLVGYVLRDSTESETNKYPLVGQIAANGFHVVDVGKSLNVNDDVVRLIKIENGSEIEVNRVVYGESNSVCAPESNTQTIGRVVNGGNTIERFSTSSKGTTNEGITLNPCPTPTTKPTSTPVPTVTPTNTPTSMPTYTNTPTRAPTKTPTPIPSNEENSPTQSAGSVIGISDENQNEKTEKEEGREAVSTQKNLAPYFLIGSGIIFIGVSAFLLIKKYRSRL